MRTGLFRLGYISFLLVVITGSQALSAKMKQIKIRGYVTQVNSPTNFEIEDYRIYSSREFQLEFENASPEVTFRKEDIRVGTELEIRGLYNDETGELEAKSIRVDLEQFKKAKYTAILFRRPEGIRKTPQGWEGLVFADGQRIQITPATQVLFKPTSREKKLLKEQQKKGFSKEPGSDSDDESGGFEPLQSLEQIDRGMILSYEGRRDPQTGIVLAERVEFSRNDLEKGEERLWKSLGSKVKPWNATQFRPGDLQINRVGKFKLIPSDEVQNYVNALGQRLIPQYQRDLPPAERGKIPFRFYVVDNKLPNAFAVANGTIVIFSSMFGILENEAQLAAVVGHEIEHAVQEHTWRQMQLHKKKLTALRIGGAVARGFGYYSLSDMANLIEAAVRNGYQRSLENQADRLGLEQMVASGYDPREAPRVWKVMTQKMGDSPTNLFWSSHDNNATRRSYLMCELKNNYQDLDYSKLGKGEEDYQRIAGLVRQTAKSKQKIKVKSSQQPKDQPKQIASTSRTPPVEQPVPAPAAASQPEARSQATIPVEPKRGDKEITSEPLSIRPIPEAAPAQKSEPAAPAVETAVRPAAEPGKKEGPIVGAPASVAPSSASTPQPSSANEPGDFLYADCLKRLQKVPVVSSPMGLKELTCGEKVTVLGKNGAWVWIRNADGKEAYVSQKFLSPVRP